MKRLTKITATLAAIAIGVVCIPPPAAATILQVSWTGGAGGNDSLNGTINVRSNTSGGLSSVWVAGTGSNGAPLTNLSFCHNDVCNNYYSVGPTYAPGDSLSYTSPTTIAPTANMNANNGVYATYFAPTLNGTTTSQQPDLIFEYALSGATPEWWITNNDWGSSSIMGGTTSKISAPTFTVSVAAPELDPEFAMVALTLLAGGITVLSGRSRRV